MTEPTPIRQTRPGPVGELAAIVDACTTAVSALDAARAAIETYDQGEPYHGDLWQLIVDAADRAHVVLEYFDSDQIRAQLLIEEQQNAPS